MFPDLLCRAVPCHAMPCHLEGLAFFHFVGLLLEKHSGNIYDVHVFPCLGIFQQQKDVLAFPQMPATSSTSKI